MGDLAIRRLEPRDRPVTGGRRREACEIVPIFQEVLARDEQLGVVQREIPGAHLGDPPSPEERVHPLEPPRRGLVAGAEGVER